MNNVEILYCGDVSKAVFFDNEPFEVNVIINGVEQNLDLIVKNFDIKDSSFSHSFGVRQDISYLIDIEPVDTTTNTLYDLSHEDLEGFYSEVKRILIKNFLSIQDDEEWDF